MDRIKGRQLYVYVDSAHKMSGLELTKRGPANIDYYQ